MEEDKKKRLLISVMDKSTRYILNFLFDFYLFKFTQSDMF